MCGEVARMSRWSGRQGRLPWRFKPQSSQALVQAIGRLEAAGNPLRVRMPDVERALVAPHLLEAMPYMSCLLLCGDCEDSTDIIVMRAGSTGLDGYELLFASGSMLECLAESLLDDNTLVRPAGVHCLDMLRMEAGLPRMGADIPVGLITPVRASLSWILDQAKMRNHLMFGWRKLFFQLAKGPTLRRVGLLLDGPVHAGCRVLSNPHRQPIGTVVSTAWSPALSRRIAMAYVRPEYAKTKKHILITVPYHLPMEKMKKKHIRSLMSGPVHSRSLRSVYRRLVSACIVPMPFVAHRYPEPDNQRRATAERGNSCLMRLPKQQLRVRCDLWQARGDQHTEHRHHPSPLSLRAKQVTSELSDLVPAAAESAT